MCWGGVGSPPLGCRGVVHLYFWLINVLGRYEYAKLEIPIFGIISGNFWPLGRINKSSVVFFRFGLWWFSRRVPSVWQYNSAYGCNFATVWSRRVKTRRLKLWENAFQRWQGTYVDSEKFEADYLKYIRTVLQSLSNPSITRQEGGKIWCPKTAL